MRFLLLAPVLLTAAFAAPPVSDSDIIERLTSDLLPLKLAVASAEPLKDEVYTSAELQSLETYSQSQAMKPFQRDMIEFDFRHVTIPEHIGRRGITIKPFIGPDQAYKLAYVLTGKEQTKRPAARPLLTRKRSDHATNSAPSHLRRSARLCTAAAGGWRRTRA